MNSTADHTSTTQITPPASPDPVVKILIISPIENSKPVMIHRKLSGDLGDVRKHYCKFNNFSDGMMKSIILVWRGMRIWDLQSCIMLGVEVDELGHASLKNADIKANEGLDHERGGLLMEAMTVDMLRQRKEEERRTEEMGGTDEAYEDDPVPQSPKKEPEVRIALRARGYPGDKKVRVKLVSATQIFRYGKTDVVL